jgi:DNA adenine methylase
MTKKAKPIVRWPGGKGALLKHLLPRIPADARCYVEVFGGGAAVLIGKDVVPGQVEVYNDKDAELVNVFRQAKHHPEELCRELEYMPNSRLEMMGHKTRPGQTEIQRAAIFIHDRMISFGGDGKSFGVGRTGKGGASNSRHAKMEMIRLFSQRFSKVIVECLDWRRCVELYDSPGSFLFCDPPYVGGRQKAYTNFMAGEMEELRDALRAAKGRWLLTVNDSAEMRRLFDGHRVTPVTRILNLGQCENQPRRSYGELIIER